jgi:hypothetical protein
MYRIRRLAVWRMVVLEIVTFEEWSILVVLRIGCSEIGHSENGRLEICHLEKSHSEKGPSEKGR